jgi:pyridoxine/pyridoxamine 5'-phosphate oxidase
MTLSLDAVLSEAFGYLAEGAADPGSLWHTPSLANIDAQGIVSQRTVVLRAWDADARRADIHTDTRSAKYEALRHDPRASLHGWDPQRQVQLRLRGQVQLHAHDPVARAAWVALRPASRATYTVIPGPGATLLGPGETKEVSEIEGFAAFCVLRLTIDELEWLHLEQGSHARARFRWDNGTINSMWLVP